MMVKLWKRITSSSFWRYLTGISNNTIQTTIFICITLIGGIIGNHLIINSQHHHNTPNIEAKCYVLASGDYLIEIEKIDENPLGTKACNYMILDSNGEFLRKNSGDARYIYCVDIDFKGDYFNNGFRANTTFIDHGLDGFVSIGDWFIIRSIGNGGVGEEGGALRLIYDYSFETMVEVTFNSSNTKETDIPTSHFEVFDYLEGEIDDIQRTTVLSHYASTYTDSTAFNISCKYSGRTDRNVTMEINYSSYYPERDFHIKFNQSIFISGSVGFGYHIEWPRSLENLTVILRDRDTQETLLHGQVQFFVVENW